MIELINVNKYYSSNGVTNLGLRNINLSFSKGEIVAITGDSGCGKSTLLNVITKIDTFDDGEILYKGNETSYFSIFDMDDFRKNTVGFIFQNYNIIDSYTVLENIMIPLLLKGLDKNTAKEQALGLIKKVGLSGKEKNRGSKLSGGEKQRCVIARALASDCEILACDEPTGNLDSKTGKEIIELIKEVAQDKLVLIVTHDYSLIEHIVTRRIKMNDGEIIEDTSFKIFPKDKDQQLNLDYKPLSNKVNFKLAKNNILFTPKKTIFTASIFFVVALIMLFLFQIIKVSNTYYYSNSYAYLQDHRLYVYNLDRSEIDMNDIKEVSNDYVVNPFYEDKYFNITTTEGVYIHSYYGSYAYDYEYKYGNDAINDNEIVIVIPRGRENIFQYKNIIGQNVDVVCPDYNHSLPITLKVAGVAISNHIENELILKNKLLDKYVADIGYNLSIDFKINDELQDLEIEYRNDVAKDTLYIPENFKNSSIEFSYKIEGLYEYSDYNIVYGDYEKNTFVFDLRKMKGGKIYECSVYGENIELIASKLRNKGYIVDIVSQMKGEPTVDDIIGNITNYLIMSLACLVLILLYFITYFILAKVYSGKKNNYEILRILGVSKKDMKKIVTYEVVIIGVFAILLAYGTFALLTNLIGALKNFKSVDLFTIIIYSISLLIFIFSTSRSFNKKLFKYSVSTSLKGVE